MVFKKQHFFYLVLAGFSSVFAGGEINTQHTDIEQAKHALSRAVSMDSAVLEKLQEVTEKQEKILTLLQRKEQSSNNCCQTEDGVCGFPPRALRLCCCCLGIGNLYLVGVKDEDDTNVIACGFWP